MNGVMPPQLQASLHDRFRFDPSLVVPAFVEPDEHVPEVDPVDRFERDDTPARGDPARTGARDRRRPGRGASPPP